MMAETESLDQFVKQQLQSGKYADYEAIVQAGLKLLQEREAELDRIAEKLQPAAEEWRSGHPGYELDAEDFIRRGRERNAAKHGQV